MLRNCYVIGQLNGVIAFIEDKEKKEDFFFIEL